jgi:inorganic pyrophosphatase
MDLDKIGSGPKGKVPDLLHVVVEVPKGSKNKYEFDKKTGALFLDRILFTTNIYPGDYGFVPQTLCEDGDPVDVLVFVSQSNYPGTVLTVKPVALLKMIDEKGRDDKIIAVPYQKLDPRFEGIDDLKDLRKQMIQEISHFFQHMKELEPGKFVKIEGWQNSKAAKSYVMKSIKRYKS